MALEGATSGVEAERAVLNPDMTVKHVVDGLRPLLDKPVEYVLATHGGPYDRTALGRALSLS